MKLQIRASNPDLDSLDELANLFVMMVEEGTMKDFVGNLDRGQILEYLGSFFYGQRETGCLFVAYEDDTLVGMLTAFHSSYMFMTDVQIAYELPWYVRPCGDRRAAWFGLLEEYEKWAKEMGCDLLTIGNYNQRLLPVYERRGYSLYSETLRKRI